MRGQVLVFIRGCFFADIDQRQLRRLEQSIAGAIKHECGYDQRARARADEVNVLRGMVRHAHVLHDDFAQFFTPRVEQALAEVIHERETSAAADDVSTRTAGRLEKEAARVHWSFGSIRREVLDAIAEFLFVATGALERLKDEGTRLGRPRKDHRRSIKLAARILYDGYSESAREHDRKKFVEQLLAAIAAEHGLRQL